MRVALTYPTRSLPRRWVRESVPPVPGAPRLLDRVREALHTRHYSRKTEKAYVA